MGYTRVFGYYIEITNTHRTKIPDNYIRKQTLKNAERYITPELKEYEERVLTAAEQASALELAWFEKLRTKTCQQRHSMQKTAAALARLDAILSLAVLARERGYCRPNVVSEPIIDIRDGRHPVLDALETTGSFVPNDTRLDEEFGRVQIITGPNMAGKSTFIRQTALLCVMAQIGSFLPARSATIGLCDRIFARVGASDEIARGQSTFMVEMTETARILNQATARSLVILDEIGRGTSTYDGISLAWSIVEYLHEKTNCRTLFATHYHELTDLANSFSGIRNLNVAVRENRDDVAFLHKIVPGTADKSYGIHVAKLAGVPKEVIARSRDILQQLEQSHVRVDFCHSENSRWNQGFHDEDSDLPRDQKRKISVGSMQLSLFGPEDHPIIDEIKHLNSDALTPLEALSHLARWQESLKLRK